MTFLPDFEEDIFISYAHIDNQPLVEGLRGWISLFHQALEIRLAQLLGDPPEFWRDEAKLSGNDYFDDAIGMRLPKTAVMVTVLTPRYVKSRSCLREVQEFHKVAQQTGGVRIDDRARIFKVVKTPVPPERHPLELQSLLGYEFYQIDPITGKPREFIFTSGPNADQSYWAKLEDLAYDIFEILEMLKGRKERSIETAVASPGTTIYLAETTFDLNDERDKIRRDLQQRGYKLLPDKPLPLKSPDFQNTVREYLAQSKLSIHLIGGNYGVIPEGDDCSVVFLQNQLAAERSRDPDFSRIIWLHPTLHAKEERQQQFIEYLQNDSRAQAGAELLQTTLEELKTVIQDTLSAASTPGSATPGGPDDGPLRIYLVCDQQDVDDITPISDYLFDSGFEVIMPLMEGDEAQARADHKENLLICDAILIHYGRAGEAWLRTKLLDLRKIAGYGRSKPLLSKAVYVTCPDTKPKQRFRTHEAMVIKSPEQFSPELLKPFVDQLGSMEGRR
jgi:hypothetical protein